MKYHGNRFIKRALNQNSLDKFHICIGTLLLCINFPKRVQTDSLYYRFQGFIIVFSASKAVGFYYTWSSIPNRIYVTLNLLESSLGSRDIHFSTDKGYIRYCEAKVVHLYKTCRLFRARYKVLISLNDRKEVVRLGER